MAPLTIHTSTSAVELVEFETSSAFRRTITVAAVAASTASNSEPPSPTDSAPSSATSDVSPLDEEGITVKTILVLISVFVLFAFIVIAFFHVSRSNRNGSPRIPPSPRSQTSSLRRFLPSAGSGGLWRNSPRTSPIIGLASLGRPGRSPAMRNAPSANLPYIMSLHRSSTYTLRGDDNRLGLILSHSSDGENNAFGVAQGSDHGGSATFSSNFDASAVTLVNSGHLQPPAYPENTAIPMHERARPVRSAVFS